MLCKCIQYYLHKTVHKICTKLKIHAGGTLSHHFPCIPQGGIISTVNPTCCIGKTILGGIYEGLRTRVNQPKIKYWKLHEFCKNVIKNVHTI